MTTSEKNWTRVGIALVLYTGIWWWGNPVRLHQRVQVAGVMLPVPFGWTATPSAAGSIGEGFNLRRVYIPFRPWVTGSISRGIWGGSFTMESARRLQQAKFAFESGDSAHYSNSRMFDLSAGRYQSLCAEGTMVMPAHAGNTSAQHVLCFVVGTPLMATFSSPKDVDGDAARILASLN